ncbi:MAG: hypothetical protein K1X75_13520 [Leptospirales bacterium]|nr:hypothetical protein [Leptospirales bacterium]
MALAEQRPGESWRMQRRPLAPGWAEAPLFQFLDRWDRRRIGLISGPGLVFPIALSWQAHLWLRGYRLHNIDCSLCFNVFNLADEALRIDIKPEALLAEIRIRRAFTPYQILDVIHQALQKAKSAPDARAIYFVLAPCKQFFDGDVSAEEGAWLLGRLFALFRELEQSGAPLVIVERRRYQHESFINVKQQLQGLAGFVWELSPAALKQPAYALSLRQTGRKEQRMFLGAVQSAFAGDSHGPHATTLFHTD